MLVELEMLLVIFACCVHNFILLQESDTEPEVDTFDQIYMPPKQLEMVRPIEKQRRSGVLLPWNCDGLTSDMNSLLRYLCLCSCLIVDK
ncbi:hypothetical protein DPMN_078543 [Dreissena polymorpha]|uniref:Uncharacterized protein n=1 Tax=Dreissena polymorpha TaxID=45954 RepID=A0A9D3YP09_DREPO|nr:hypothetical protein DPMN_078543 [Dreissena polymorpha]